MAGKAGAPSGPSVFSHSQLSPPLQDPPIYPNVARIEQSFQGPTGLERVSLNDRLPLRPAYGTKGYSIQLYANYFPMTVAAKKVYLYEIKINRGKPGESRRPVRKTYRIVQLFLNCPRLSGVKTKIATEYRKFLVSSVDLQESLNIQARPEKIISFWDDEITPLPGSEQELTNTYFVHLEPHGEHSYSIESLLRSVQDPNAAPPTARESILQCLNIVIGHDARTRSLGTSPTAISLAGNRHYRLDAGKPRPLGGGLQAQLGYLTSVRPVTGGYALHIQIKHVAAFLEAPVKIITDQFRGMGVHSVLKLEQFLKFVRVSTTHLTKNKRKTILGLVPKRYDEKLRCSELGASPFEVSFKANDRWVTVAQYFSQQYPGVHLNKDYPAFNVGTQQNPAILPAEAMKIINGQPVTRQLYPKHTAAMIKVAVRKAPENARAIAQDGQQMLDLLPRSDRMTAFGMTVSQQMTKLNARVLPRQMVKYCNDKRDEKLVEPINGFWNIKDTQLFQPVRIFTWLVLVLVPEKPPKQDSWYDPSTIMQCVNGYVDTLKAMGINIDQPQEFDQTSEQKKQQLPPLARLKAKQRFYVRSVNPHDAASLAALEGFLKNAPKVDFQLVLSSFDSTAIYSRVKRIADCETGTPSTFVLGKKFTKLRYGRPDPGFMANLGLKVNVALGGINHVLARGSLGFVEKQPTMFVGLDVTHPTNAPRENAVSIVGIVCSVDMYAARYLADIAVQPANQELVSALKELMIGRLEAFRRVNNGLLPVNIIVMRDGVGEGMYGRVLQSELEQIKLACEDIYLNGQPKPKITFMVVGKRGNTRFYPTSNAKGCIDLKSGSPPNGTVVDTTICEPANLDWYLQAHRPIQGTAKPCHFIVLHNDIFRDKANNMADAIQGLTHSMCYLWQVSTTAVSVPPPAYYADRVCTRARAWFAGFFDPTASDHGSNAGSAPPTAQNVRIHDNLKNAMFFV